MTGKVLLSDISNGAYIRLAIAEAGRRPELTRLYACQSFDNFVEAIENVLDDNGNPQLTGAAFSASGWEVDGQIDLVHYGFKIARRHIEDMLEVRRVAIINDFVAKALAIPSLHENERSKVCGGAGVEDECICVIGPSTGFGGAILTPDGAGGWSASHCEGGHSDFAPGNRLEIEILKVLMAKFGHVSRERILSTSGLCALWQCLDVIEGVQGDVPDAEEIVAQACIGHERANKVIKLMTEILAGTAADYALISGARGGIYLSGTVLDLIGDLFDPDVFAARFYDKGRASSYVRDIPVYRIVADNTEIIGLSTLTA